MSRKIYTILSLVLIGAFALAACAAPATSAPTQAPAPTNAAATRPPAPTTAPAATNTAAPKPVTINWWHISTNDPGLSFWARAGQPIYGRSPECHYQHYGVGKRSLQDQVDHRFAVRHSP